MAALLDWMASTIRHIIQLMNYPGILLLSFTEVVFPPIPSELVLPFAGFLVQKKELTLVGVLLASTIGSAAGGTLLYYVGKWADEPIIRAFVRRFGKWFLLSEDDLNRSLEFFGKYGEAVIFFGRLIPIIRSLISLPAGMNRMSLWRFLSFTVLGTLLWNAFLTISGMILGANWERILDIIDSYEKVWYVIIAVAVIWFVAHKLIERRKAEKVSGGAAAARSDVE